ncbi:hypothetical protein R4575_17030 [Acinetobacter baumannii]|nr:hypothetical protein [Acinetobacter baumannii]
MKIQYLVNVSSLTDLKRAYQRLCFKHHPDRGGKTEIMQIINAEYDYLLKTLIDAEDESNYSEDKYWKSKEHHTEVEKIIHQKISELVGKGFKGIRIETIGVWIWVSGDTKPYKEELKEMGFKWSTNHKKWSFAGQKSGWTNKGMSYIRKKYGAKTVKNEADESTKNNGSAEGASIPSKAKLA